MFTTQMQFVPFLTVNCKDVKKNLKCSYLFILFTGMK